MSRERLLGQGQVHVGGRVDRADVRASLRGAKSSDELYNVVLHVQNGH